MRALAKVAPGPGLELVEWPEPQCGPDQVKLRVLRAGLCGTDLHLHAWDDWAAATVQAVGWLSNATGGLRPAWTFLHLAVLAWGLTLLVLARQPAWAEQAGRALWQRVRPAAAGPAGVFGAGLVWTFTPCGLLWSALLIAALAGTPAQGALAMAAFAVGSGVWLGAFPLLLRRLRRAAGRFGEARITRLSGLLLVAAAAWALWADALHRFVAWCMS